MPVRRMLGNIGCRTAILAADSQPLRHAQHDKSNGRHDANAFICGQQADEKGRKTHDENSDEKRIFASDEIAEPTKHQSTEGAHRKSRREHEQRKNKGRRIIEPGKKLLGKSRRERAIDKKIIPLEHSAERRSKDHFALFLCHPRFGR